MARLTRLSRGRLLAIGLFAVVVFMAVWWINRGEPIPSKPPAGAPPVGACFAVTPEQAQNTMPWPGGARACGSAHTAEVYRVGQVDHELISKARSAKGDEAKIAANLMLAEARRACTASASDYLGANWRAEQVTVLATWVTPWSDGFFGCALAQETGPAGDTYVTRTGSLKGLGTAGQLAIGCVVRAGNGVRFASCDDQHTGEFVGLYQVKPDNVPYDAKAVTDAVTRGCAQAALAYLGLPSTAQRTDLHVGYVGPSTAGDWLGSDQTFSCYASATTMMRGTIRDLGSRPLPT